MSTVSSSTRAGQLAEKVILGAIAGGSAAIVIVDTVFLVGRIIRLSSGPVELTGVPTAGPIDAGFASATFDTVKLTVAELSAGGRVFLMGSAVLTWLLVIGICAVAAWLCVRVLFGKPFGVAATWGIGAVSLLVILSGLGTPLLNGMAAQRALVGLDVKQIPMFLVTVDLAPLGWGLALAVVAGAFEIGQRMQRETDGLV